MEWRETSSDHLDELSLAMRAADGDSQCAVCLRRRALRCAVALARKVSWLEGLDAVPLEVDIPEEVALRLAASIQLGLHGDNETFRAYFYRMVACVAADAARQHDVHSIDISLAAPFEDANGSRTTVRQFLESRLALSGLSADTSGVPSGGPCGADVIQAVDRLDPWCRVLLREVLVDQRPRAAVARDHKTPSLTLAANLSRCSERLFRGILGHCLVAPENLQRDAVAQTAAALPDDLRGVFLPWWTEGLPLREVAARCGLTTEETRRRLLRAKLMLWQMQGA